MGYPCILNGEGGRYVRNEYMWNLCFVFEAKSSLEAFEPVIRKCARILRSAEVSYPSTLLISSTRRTYHRQLPNIPLSRLSWSNSSKISTLTLKQASR